MIHRRLIFSYFKESKQFLKPTSKEPNQPISVPEQSLMLHITRNAPPNNPSKVKQMFDQFCRRHWMMHVGPQKAQIIQKVVQVHRPCNILEVGAYCGYSALLFSIFTQNKSKITSLEINEEFKNIAQSLHRHSGIEAEVRLGTVQSSEQYLKANGDFDLVFLDHEKDQYKKDLQLLISYGVLRRGHIVIADNIINPGCPQYLSFMKGNTKYGHTLYHTHDAFTNEPDAVLVSAQL